ncbi:DUF6468 domain-containing protein, partial [Caulobacter sp. 17J65-9]|uniref:DUF6468 domain-containing protein n=1 Tax=Caulobacter sp. 17J65-9 TaxID=2709382 RepID=UPI0013CBFB1B
MSIVAVALQVLLAVLLIAALIYGWRLDKKLRTLRDSQIAFAASVRDLDLAAARAEAGLENLRRAGEEAHDGLHDRILKARELKAQLEALIARAERAPAPAPVRSPPEPERPALPRPRAEDRLKPLEPAPLRR